MLVSSARDQTGSNFGLARLSLAGRWDEPANVDEARLEQRLWRPGNFLGLPQARLELDCARVTPVAAPCCAHLLAVVEGRSRMRWTAAPCHFVCFPAREVVRGTMPASLSALAMAS